MINVYEVKLFNSSVYVSVTESKQKESGVASAPSPSFEFIS